MQDKEIKHNIVIETHTDETTQVVMFATIEDYREYMKIQREMFKEQMEGMAGFHRKTSTPPETH